MQKLLWAILFTGLILFICPSKAYATLYINEFASDTAGTTADPDWVEIYNSGTDSVDLNNYQLKDAANNTKDLSGSLLSGSFAAFDWSNRLNSSGDIVQLLLLSDSTIVDQVAYGDTSGSTVNAPTTNQSAGRQSDGGSSWVVFSSTSKGLSNNSSSPAPTATSIPTPTPTSAPSPSASTSTPTPKPTSTPTPTTKPTNTSAPTSKSTPTPEPITQGKEEIILGVQNDNTLISQEEVSATEEAKTTGWKTPLIAAGFILPGLGLLGFSAYSYLKKAKSGDGNIGSGDSEDI